MDKGERRIVLLGLPASGKGTRRELLQKRFDIPAASTERFFERRPRDFVGASRACDPAASAAKIRIFQMRGVIRFRRHIRAANPCPNCRGKLEARQDDTGSSLARRREECREKTVPVTDFYDRRSILARVDASRAGDQFFKDVSELIIG